MLVDSVLQLLLNHCQNAAENLNLTYGKVQRLVARIREKLVARHLPPQLRTCQKIRVKDQCRPLWENHVGVRLNENLLARRERSDGHLVEVVFGTAVREFAAFVLFQEQRVHAIVNQTFVDRLLLFTAHHAHQRVQSLKAVKIVELLNCIEMYLFHFLLLFANLQNFKQLFSNRLAHFIRLAKCLVAFDFAHFVHAASKDSASQPRPLKTVNPTRQARNGTLGHKRLVFGGGG